MKNVGGFAAGTLVHTDKGLVPIDKIEVGDTVLSKPESGEGELVYKRVTETFVTENQPIWAMDIAGPYGLDENGDDYDKREFLFTTENHLFRTFERTGRYEIDTSNGKWVSALSVATGDPLLHFSGKFVDVIESLDLYQTLEPNKAFYMIQPSSDDGIVLDVDLYRNNTLRMPDYFSDESFMVSNWDENGNTIFDPYLTAVYNFEVEGFHTYFVGELGILVRSVC